VAINYKTQDFVEEVKKATNGKGVDVILDMVTGTYLQREIDCLADDGRIVVIAIMGGSKSEINTGQILRRRLTVTGSTLRPRPVAFKRQIAKELHEHVWPLLNSGKLKPVIYKTFSLEQAADAHRLMESSEHVGKIVLTV
jgi:NADPH2:quinone reductase